jgi:predicted nucleic acid-binding protein
MFVLDTNVVSELRKARTGRANPGVIAWATAARKSRLFLSAITVLELEQGVLLMERRDAAQGALLRTWLEGQVLAAFQSQVLPVDTAVALRCVRLHVPDPRAYRDALIAASALEHGMTVVTHNVADFENTGVKLLNPWSAH